jgi:hypothetical protein
VDARAVMGPLRVAALQGAGGQIMITVINYCTRKRQYEQKGMGQGAYRSELDREEGSGKEKHQDGSWSTSQNQTIVVSFV